MFRITMDDFVLQRRFSDLERRQIPFAAVGALNDSMFAVVRSWRVGIQHEFDAPTPRTVNAVSYKKATRQDLFADVFLKGRDDVEGSPPARYLAPQATGGPREEKPFEHLLRQAGILGPDEYVVPARGFPLDAYGNVPGGIVTAILSDLQASSDPAARSTRASRAKRARRRNINKRGVYFESSPKLSASQGRRQHLPRAIYQRTRFSSGSAIRMVFIIVQGPPSYRKRFDPRAFSERAFREAFPFYFEKRLLEGVRTARIR